METCFHLFYSVNEAKIYLYQLIFDVLSTSYFWRMVFVQATRNKSQIS